MDLDSVNNKGLFYIKDQLILTINI